ncbi:MAG: thioredoxin fold domain-containing protein [Chitinophagaceae bacterium]|nr:thioredoxin fold domain-containing protein [Chitinophagaceae bacterium]
MKYIWGLLLLALMACESNSAQNTSNFSTLAVAEFKQQLEKTKNVQLLDVRTPGEYMEEHLENALNIDYNDPNFADQLNNLDKNKPTFIYCLSGGRSNNAMNTMKAKGFKEVYNMKGGILEWKGSQFPLTKNVFNGWKGMTKEAFEKITQNSTPTLVDFRAKWCGPCKQLKPILDELAKEYAGKLNVVEIDIDENKSLADDMHITNIPLLVYYKDGKVAMNIEGFTEKKDIIAALKLQ